MVVNGVSYDLNDVMQVKLMHMNCHGMDEGAARQLAEKEVAKRDAAAARWRQQHRPTRTEKGRHTR
jgi:hypothetical protein